MTSTTTKSKSAEQAKKVRSNEKKWGATTVAVGWTFVPNILLERQAVLGINATQLNILLIILKHWWDSDRLPFPEMNTIAKAMDCSRSTVQKNIRTLEKAGFITRKERKAKNGGNKSNEYDFSGLVKILKGCAEEELAVKAAERERRAIRQTKKSKRPSLKLVKSEDQS